MVDIDRAGVIKDCIIDEKNRKVVLKFYDGTVKMATAEEGDEFNPETGILWAFVKFMLDGFGIGSAHDIVQYCIELDKTRRERAKNHKQTKNPPSRGMRSKACFIDEAGTKPNLNRETIDSWEDLMSILASLLDGTLEEDLW